MKIVTNSPLFKLPLLRRYSAIVLGRNCYLKSGISDERLVRHELIHLEQMDRVGTLTFYLIYLRDYCWNLIRFREHDRAYREIPFEKEAYARENDERIPVTEFKNQV